MATIQQAATKFVEADIAREEAEQELIKLMLAEGCDECILGEHLIEKDGCESGEPFLSRRDAPRRVE
ncbi:MAG: hypothetical protein HQ582_22170 [Planctomycetes bacterium]|nr:hypothetical protein [Planctomycetota bacterium]